jgi:hypothetical protein
MASRPPARNEPCPCGSGRKYKHCCGVIPVRAAPAVADVAPAIPSAERSCGTCTACCDGWLAGTIRGHDMKPGVPCHFRGNGSCTIYEDRPVEPCRNFFCAWRTEGNPFPDSFRPDRLGVIILNRRWSDRPVYELVAAGRDPDESLLGWMREYSGASGVPFVYAIDWQFRGFGGTPEFQQEMRDKAARGEIPLA